MLNENGWPAAAQNPEFGGQGLPHVVDGIVKEMMNGANMAMMTYPGLTVGAGHLIEDFGTDLDRSMFVESMYTGRWSGTMCLTEPDAGSDVGLSRTKAVPDLEWRVAAESCAQLRRDVLRGHPERRGGRRTGAALL